MATNRSISPDANIIFYPFVQENTLPFVTGKKPASQRMNVTTISAQKSIMSIQTSKPKGGTGTWTCMLASDRNWKGVLEPGCWCLIYIKDSPLTGNETSEADSGLKMIGIVKTVQRVEGVDPMSGIRTVRFQVSGEDFHSVFNSPIYININLSSATGSEQGSIADALSVLGTSFGRALTPAQMVRSLVDSLLGFPGFTADKSGTVVQKLAFLSRGGQPYLIPQAIVKRILGFDKINETETFFTRMVTFFLQQDLIGVCSIQSDLGTMVNAWSLIQTYSNLIVNEVYTDLLPVKISSVVRMTPSLVLRSIPFTSPSGKKSIGKSSLITMQDAPKDPTIPTRAAGFARASPRGKSFTPGVSSNFYTSRSIFEADIFSFRSGKSDAERFNFFYVLPNLSGDNDPKINEAAFLDFWLHGGGFNAIGDRHSIARYGLRPYHGYSDYMFGDNSAIGVLNSIVKDIYQSAYLFENGQVTVSGTTGHIPVGTNIIFAERGWIAHVEQVSYSFVVNDNGAKTFRTTIAFSRLQNLDGSPIDAVENNQTNGRSGNWDRGVNNT